MSDSSHIHHVVIVGAGFGGLEVVRRLGSAPVRITLIDQSNHHCFQPLLYQVATASLANAEIAWPVRRLVRRRKQVTTLLSRVVGINSGNAEVVLDDESVITYDTLVLATGARGAYFGHDEWELYAPTLKTLEDATSIRGRVLLSFERAERESDPQRRAALLTFVIVGGGATGVELAGTIAELAHDTLWQDFRHIDTRSARIVLIEAGARILPSFAEPLATYAQATLARMGVEIVLGSPVRECTSDGVVFGDRRLSAKVILWAAGVRASPAADWLGVAADHAGRVLVQPDLSVPAHPEIFVIGDTAGIDAWDGRPVPGNASAAKQEGRHVAISIRTRLCGDAACRPFRYQHFGSLATIGKRSAVIEFGRIRLHGRIAWWIWGLAHIYFLIGTRNRLAVALNWLWIYTRGDRGARLIMPSDERQEPSTTVS